MDNKKRKVENNTSNSEERSFGILRKFIERIDHEELLDFITNISIKDESIHKEIEEMLNSKKELRKVFVRSIPFETSEEMLKDAMSNFGEVEESMLVRDQTTKKPKGFGFVVYKDFRDAQKAIEEGKVNIGGRSAFIHFAVYNYKEDDGQYNKSNNSMSKKDKQIFVRNLDDSIDTEVLREVFEEFGAIDECFVPTDKETGKQKGYGFVKFFTLESAIKSMEEPNKEVNGIIIKCDYSSKKRKSNEWTMDNHPYNYYDGSLNANMRSLNFSQAPLLPASGIRPPAASGYLGSSPMSAAASGISPIYVMSETGQLVQVEPNSNTELQLRLQQLQLAQAQIVQKMGPGGAALSYADPSGPSGHPTHSVYGAGGYGEPSYSRSDPSGPYYGGVSSSWEPSPYSDGGSVSSSRYYAQQGTGSSKGYSSGNNPMRRQGTQKPSSNSSTYYTPEKPSVNEERNFE